MRTYLAYFRVSTDKQGLSGLGLDAQRAAIVQYLKASGGCLLQEFTEIESGKSHKNRPQLLAAITFCQKRKATLLIARLDRLARNVAFISQLMESDVDFVAVDMPHASRLTIHILAAVAEHEREMISQRTKAALAAAKARGVKLGNPNCRAALEKARRALHRKPVPETAVDIMLELRSQQLSLRRIAQKLNESNIHTPNGKRWYASTVKTALSRFPEGQQPGYPESRLSVAPESPKAVYPASTQSSQRASWFSCCTSSSGLNGFSSGAKPSVVTPNAGRRATTDGELTMADLAESFRMLDTFASVGATHFDVTFTGLDGEKCGFRREQTARQLRNSLPHLIPGLTDRKQNLIVRPYSEKTRFVQLDDIGSDRAKQLSPVSCLILQTSAGNHQAWVAVTDVAVDDVKDFARRLRKGTGADLTASGATRCAGTRNYKRKYEPEFPEVKILQAAPGRVASKAQLEHLGFLAAPEPVPVAAATPFRVSSAGRNWPDYQRCVLGAPMKHGENKPDISRADFFWSMMSAQRGWNIPEIASRLMELSSKAQENGEHYAQLTAENAMAATERQRRSRA